MANETVTLRVSRRFPYPPERLFDAWIDPKLVCRWLFATEDGQMQPPEIDARVGGGFRITDRREDGDVAHVGTYLEVDRPSRLVFTLQVPKYSDEVDRVTVEFTALEDGGCEMLLIHETAPNWAEQTQAGWTMLFDRLARVLG